MLVSPLKGSNTALIGPAGTGKTFSLRSLAQVEGLRPVVLFTENSADRISDLPSFKWATVMPSSGSFSELWDVAKLVNTSSFKQLAAYSEGVNKQNYQRFMDLLVMLNSFVDVRSKENLGPADSWGPDTVLIIDGWSNINTMAMQLTVGAKPNPSEGEWGMAMQQCFNLMLLLTTGLKCHLIMIAHIEPELDPTTNLTVNMMSSLGRKLAPKLPKMFSDVILARRVGNGTEYDWSNTDLSAQTKAGLLPPTPSMTPSFVPLFEAWKAKGGIFSPTYAEAEVKGEASAQ